MARATNLDTLDKQSQQTLLKGFVEKKHKKTLFRRLELCSETFEDGVKIVKKIVDTLCNMFTQRVGFF